MSMSDISTYLGNAIIDHMLRNQAFTPPTTIYVAAHTSDPGLNGANEVGTAGSNGYARQAIALDAASSKATANTDQEQITMPNNLSPNTLVGWLGIWDAATGGNFLWKIPLTGTNLEATVGTDDVFNTGENHGLSAGDSVTFDEIGSALPAGISANTTYYVIASGLTSTAFKVSTSSGGSTIDVTAAGGVIVRKVTQQPFNASNILQLAAGALTLRI